MMEPPQGADPEDYYVKQDRVGKGSFGEVYKGFDKRSRQPVAIKIIDLENAEDEIDDIQQEIAILSQLDSPHVTKYVPHAKLALTFLSYMPETDHRPSLPFRFAAIVSSPQIPWFLAQGHQLVDCDGVLLRRKLL